MNLLLGTFLDQSGYFLFSLTNVIIRTMPSCCSFVRDRKVSNLILVSFACVADARNLLPGS